MSASRPPTLFRQYLGKLRNQAEACLGEADRERRDKIDLVLRQLLEELEKSNRLETRFDSNRIGRLFDTLRKINDVAAVYNFLVDLFANKDRETRFLATVQDFGLGRQELLSTYYAAHSVASVLSIEQFKLLLLFMMVRVHKVSDFRNIMRNVAPKSWRKLEPFVENEFRNALAHGAYLIERERIILFKNAKLDVLREMTGEEFVMAAKNENILFWCLLLLFLERMARIYRF